MQPPTDFMGIVRDGARLLQSLAGQLRVRAERTPDEPELWLSVRDLEGLAGRLSEADEWQWRNGFATLLIGGQDLGVLDELHSGSSLSLQALTSSEQELLRSLRYFLQHAADNEFDFGAPAA